MKNRFEISALILIILTHSACRTSKFSSRQQTRLAVEEQSDMKSRVREVNRYVRSETITDSSGQSYQLTIFPADTFKFSLQNGFIGKASKVVVKGFSNQLIRISDTSTFSGSLTSETEGKMTREVTAKTGNRSTSVERKGFMWKGICLGLIVGLIILGIWRKFKGFRVFPR
ncbi:MAG: hypothetical protein WKF68_14505 [Daejeonella sp.]